MPDLERATGQPRQLGALCPTACHVLPPPPSPPSPSTRLRRCMEPRPYIDGPFCVVLPVKGPFWAPRIISRSQEKKKKSSELRSLPSECQSHVALHRSCWTLQGDCLPHLFCLPVVIFAYSWAIFGYSLLRHMDFESIQNCFLSSQTWPLDALKPV